MESPKAKSGRKGLAPSALDSAATGQTKPTQSLSTKRNELKLRSVSESSDELQGEVTTQPIPKDIDERQTRARLPTKEHFVSPDRSSPTDIVPTKFEGSNKKAKRKHNISERLDIIYLLFGHDATKSGVNGRRTADLNHERIEIEGKMPGMGLPVSIELRKVVKIFHGKDPSRKVRLFLSKGASPHLGERVDIEFWNSQMKHQLLHVLRDKEIAIHAKESDFMDKAFQTHKFEAQNHQHSKRPLPEHDSTSQPSANCPARQKISSNLQGSVDEPGSKRVKQDLSSSSIARTGNGITATRAPEGDGKTESASGVEIPVKTFHETQASLERETRSTRRLRRDADDSADSHPSHSRPIRAKDENREKWKKPMVYPRVGKRRAEVNVEDRDRLREGEFLNDNLVGFYLRFLEDHLQRTNPDVAEGIYLFNSYFFPTLKNGRSINYSAVEKWTRNIDLFSYDYVIVPVNQDLHWYFAIICNLPSLDLPCASPADQSSAPASDKEISTQPESEVHEISESPEPELVSATTNTTFGAQFDQPRTEKEGKPAATEEVDSSTQGSEEQKQDVSSPGSWPDGAENITSPPPKELPGRWWDQTNPTTSVNQFGLNSKKKGRPDLKLHPRQTTIITFDSLDLPRSPTIRLLREYICQEALSKRGVEIDPKEIKGMRARQIPLQPNFSDCGLYLLAYIEKFVQDPDTFITRVMQRDMDAHVDWPPLGSGMLRHRLRKFLDDMYEEQKKHESTSVMADQPRVSFLLGPPLPSQEDDEDRLEERRPATPGRSENLKPVQEDHVKGTGEDHLSVEIQVKATPPPGEPERPKKSPQGKRKG
ncbi:uncharacterized protein N7484_003397 [Penicillium longicatenatum]|uniref:uncharacterized protein n=1 Tax=Penicillium longicatenatum TaxID=1561947 RepID=UPI002549330A|nr:uncharacterized protein N7484_003397 [Penicillium longicatenatum]KAJ5649674.1 hypothetical protein N7484_003397 [Penicillium longicatenatum]